MTRTNENNPPNGHCGDRDPENQGADERNSSPKEPKLTKGERKEIERREAIKKAAQEAREKAGILWELEQGDDVEIAECIAKDLPAKYLSEIVYAEGNFWRYEKTNWVILHRDEIRKHAHQYSGLFYGTTGRRLQLNKPRLDSIIYELGVKLAQESKFAVCPGGVNCLDGFVVWETGVRHSSHTHLIIFSVMCYPAIGTHRVGITGSRCQRLPYYPDC